MFREDYLAWLTGYYSLFVNDPKKFPKAPRMEEYDIDLNEEQEYDENEMEQAILNLGGMLGVKVTRKEGEDG